MNYPPEGDWMVHCNTVSGQGRNFRVLDSQDHKIVMKHYIRQPNFVGYMKLDKDNRPIFSDG
jgi:hypothetical protein